MNETIRIQNDYIQLLDQRALPFRIGYIDIRSLEDSYNAIANMIVRGAPAIGVTAAFGIALAFSDKIEYKSNLFKVSRDYLFNSRPTAVNLKWALDMQEMEYNLIKDVSHENRMIFKSLFENAKKLYYQDIEINQKMGDFGQTLLKKGSTVITHCNAGALATCGWGTALGVIRSAFKKGRVKMVYADETRPYLQGSRLTAWELKQDNIPVKVITDSSSGYFMKNCKIDCAIVGADRIAANGDTANKIGTYLLAINCRHHGVPFYVAAPLSTFDPLISDGSKIPIENRDKDEIRKVQDYRIIPEDFDTENPSFDITPNDLITAYITEKGIIQSNQIRDLFGK